LSQNNLTGERSRRKGLHSFEQTAKDKKNIYEARERESKNWGSRAGNFLSNQRKVQ